ncbi:MAG: hypothetical protein CMO61_12975 [Verrucomicrobiales bacterium]|nr:hypothetical protein [Verrucomicrobiales bacterium]
MTHRISLSLLTCLLLLASIELAAQEWSRFRGENGTGIGKISSLPDSFTKADYDWAIKLRGVGHSSPVLWGDQLFLTLADEEKGQRVVACYRADNGKQLWKWATDVDKHNLHKLNNFASSTPVTTADAVYVVWGSGEKTEALGLTHQGKLLWKKEWENFSSDHGFGSSPIISEGTLILHTDSVTNKKSFVIGLDPKTGEELWRVDRATQSEDEKHLTAYNTPVTLNVNGTHMVIVLQTNDGWRGLSPQTGEKLWRFKGDYSLRSVGSIATGEGIVFATFGSGGQGKQATALKPNAKGDPEMLYELGLSDGLTYVPTPLIYRKRIFLWGDGGILTCRNAETGELVYRERIGGNFFSSPVIADGKLWCGSLDGELVSVTTGDQFKVLGRSRLNSGMNATPAVANNRLFLRTQTHLISIKGR